MRANTKPATIDSHRPAQTATVHALRSNARCRLCGVQLMGVDAGDHMRKEVCGDCRNRPEARRLGPAPAARHGRTPARDFTPAEQALIEKVHGYMSASQLLSVLNERLMCDLGPDAAPYTIEQLHAKLRDTVVPTTASDWASLRKLLAQAQRAGVLDAITGTTIDDFAVVFSLSPPQVLRLKDVILGSDTAKGARL